MDFELAYHRLVDAEPRQARKVARAVADEFGDSLLTLAPMSDEHVNFICRVFFNRVLAGRPGLENLLMEFYLEREKLSETQLKRFYGCLSGSFGHLADETLAFVIGDFIARVAPPDRALALLREMTVKINSRDALEGVFLGLDILRNHHKAHAVLLAAIEAAGTAAQTRATELQTGDDAPPLRLIRQVERAFAHRAKPEAVIEPRNPMPDDEDALWFAGRDWREITARDWNDHSDAFFRFAPEAFRYYLQSILCLVAKNPDENLLAADALIGCLDRSPNVEWWDQFLLDHLLGLEIDEYDGIDSWIVMLSEKSHCYKEDSLTRASQTVHLLREQAEMVWLRKLSDRS